MSCFVYSSQFINLHFISIKLANLWRCRVQCRYNKSKNQSAIDIYFSCKITISSNQTRLFIKYIRIQRIKVWFATHHSQQIYNFFQSNLLINNYWSIVNKKIISQQEPLKQYIVLKHLIDKMFMVYQIKVSCQKCRDVTRSWMNFDT